MSGASGAAVRTGAASAPARERPHVVVVSSLFPGPSDPVPGVFIRERMFRVARLLPVEVTSPRPWSPLDGLLRRWRPGFRPPVPVGWTDAGVTVHAPRFPSAPGWLKRWDAAAMAHASYPLLRRLRAEGRLDLLDAHFGYPDGYAAVLLGRWLDVPVTVTLRGSEARLATLPWARRRLAFTVRRAARVFAVADSLRRLAVDLGADPARAEVIGNGVDTERFHPRGRRQTRARLGIGADDPVLVTVGGLCERKGQQRVIDVMPRLLRRFPRLRYLVVGGGSGEGDERQRLRARAAALGVAERVHLLGPVEPDAVPELISAGDVFVLASRNEGWANVLLEAMACAVPVVATDVGGNREVVSDAGLGRVVAFGDAAALGTAITEALTSTWDRRALRQHALDHDWQPRVERLVARFREIHEADGPGAAAP